MAVGVDGYGKQAGIRFSFSILLGLVGFDDTYDADVKEAADMGGFVHEHENVERVAVFAERGRDEAEVEGKYHAFGKQATQFE